MASCSRKNNKVSDRVKISLFLTLFYFLLTILLILKVNSCVLHHFCTEREAFFKRVGSMRRIFCAFILLFMASIFLRCANFLSFFFKLKIKKRRRRKEKKKKEKKKLSVKKERKKKIRIKNKSKNVLSI